LDTSTLRWILIVVGIVIVASIFLFGNPDKKRQPKASRRDESSSGSRHKKGASKRQEPTLEGLGEGRAPSGAGSDRDDEPLGQGELDIGAAEAAVLQATVSTGMEFGDMNIFHRVIDGVEQPVFSLADAAKPGHFERDAWNTFETSGVALFLALPGPMQALDAWDAMLAAARRMSEILHAELLDEDRSPFTRQREAQIREEMRDYDRRKSKRG
jgi:cell division protein ZipA